MRLETHVEGCVNGTSFCGIGFGDWDAVARRSDARIVFDRFPDTFAPTLCRSWHCKHHPPRPEYSPLAGVKSWEVRGTIHYAGAAEGAIETSGVSRVVGDAEVGFARFHGAYSGPTRLDRVLRHRETIWPAASGFEVRGRREAIVEGERVISIWEERIAILDGTIRPDLAPFAIDYEWRAWSWEGLVYQKSLSVAGRKVSPVSVDRAAAADVPALERLFEEAVVRRYPPGRGPADWKPDFARWIASADYAVFAARSAGKLVGFALAKAERAESQDFLAPPFGELVYLAIEEPAELTGAGTALYEAVLDWCKKEGLPQLRATAHGWDAGLVRFLERRGHRRSVVVSDLLAVS